MITAVATSSLPLPLPRRKLRNAAGLCSFQRVRRRLKLSAGATNDPLPISIFDSSPSKRPPPPGQLSPPINNPPTGKVLAAMDGVIMIETSFTEIPIGSEIRFAGGQQGLVLWRHISDVYFALLLDQEQPSKDDPVTFELDDSGRCREFQFETGRHLIEQVVSQIPREAIHDEETAEMRPLVNTELDITSRQSICQPLTMKHKGIDILTPIGRGQCILLISSDPAADSRLVEHMFQAQRNETVTTIYACLDKSEEETDEMTSRFQQLGLMKQGVFFKASKRESLAQRFVVMCTALSTAGHPFMVRNAVERCAMVWIEYVRDRKGDALVVIDSIQPLPDIWSTMQKLYNQLSTSRSEGEKEKLVEVDGTFMAAEIAERHRFFSSILQRSSKAFEALGGGSLTLIPVAHGSPATGIQQSAIQTKLAAIEQDPKLSPALKSKLRSKLSSMTTPSSTADTGATIQTYLIEEFMSIADGQIVTRRTDDGRVVIDPSMSVSRIGTRAYPPALKSLAPKIRFQLAQATDNMQSSTEKATAESEAWNSKVQAMKTALVQETGRLTPLSHQVVMLLALEIGVINPKTSPRSVERIMEHFEQNHEALLTSIDVEQTLNDEQRNEILYLLRVDL